MRTDHSFLICRRRSPLGCRLFYNKAGQRNITDALLRWIKAILAHINFHRFLIRVFPLEIHIENGLILLFILLHIPGVNRECLIPGFFIDLRLFHLIQTCHLIHGFSIQIHFSGVCCVGCDKPVTADQCRIWIVIPKQSVRNARCPHITFQMLPVIHNFRTGNHSFSRFHRTVHNSCILTSRIRRIYIFPIYARRYKHLVAGPCNFCRLGNRLKWIFLLPISASHSISIYINLHFSLTSHFFTFHKLLLFFCEFSPKSHHSFSDFCRSSQFSYLNHNTDPRKTLLIYCRSLPRCFDFFYIFSLFCCIIPFIRYGGFFCHEKRFDFFFRKQSFC